MGEELKFVPGKGLLDGEEVVAEFDVRVLTIYYFISQTGKRVKKAYDIEATTFDGEKLDVQRVSNLQNLSYFDLWPQIIDAGLDRKQKKGLLLRLQQTSRKAKIVKRLLIESNGFFVLEDEQHILTLGDVVLEDSKTDIEIVTPENIIRLRWKPHHNQMVFPISECAKDYLNVCPGVSEILFSGMLLAAAKPFFIEAGYNPAVCINVFGRTASYKTSLVKAMLYPQKQVDFIASLVNDRIPNTVRRIQECYGFPFVLEDYHPAESRDKNNHQINMIDAAVRCIENNKESAVVFVTSEYLGGAESLQGRTLQVEIEKSKVDLNILTELQRKSHLMSQIVYSFIAELFKNREAVVGDIRMEYESLLMNGERLRIDESGGYLQIVAKLYEKYECNSDIEFFSKLQEALITQKKRQQKNMMTLSLREDERYIKALYEAIHDESIYSYKDENNYEFTKTEITFRDRACILTKAALKYGLEKHLNMKVNMKKVASILDEEDLLKHDAGTYMTKYKERRVYCIYIDPLKALYECITGKR